MYGINLEQKQTHSLSQSYIQSLEILALSNNELQSLLENEYLENPIFEYTENTATGTNRTIVENHGIEELSLLEEMGEDIVLYIKEQLDFAKYSKKELIDFAKFLEWQAEEKQIDQNTVNAYMLIVFTAIITEAFKNMLLDPMFEMVGKVPWVNVELFSILTALISVLFVCGIIELVGYIIKKHSISDNSFYLDYKKIIDEMIERKEKKKK